MMKRTVTRQKRINFFVWLIVIANSLKGNKVALRHVVSQSECLDEEVKTASLSFYVIPGNATVVNVQCFRGPTLENSTRQHVYTFILNRPERPTKSKVPELKERVDHNWNPNEGVFTLVLSNPTPEDAMWYRCDFIGAGRHRRRRSLLELPYLPEERQQAFSMHYNPENVESLKFEANNRDMGTLALKNIVSYSSCTNEMQEEAKLIWQIQPQHAKIYFLKCFRKSNIRSDVGKEHIYTLRPDTGKVWTGKGTLEGRLSHQWNPEEGMFSLLISEPIEEDAKMWYFCEFTGTGRHRKHTDYIYLKWKHTEETTLRHKVFTKEEFLTSTKPTEQSRDLLDVKLKNTSSTLLLEHQNGHHHVFQTRGVYFMAVLLGIYKIT